MKTCISCMTDKPLEAFYKSRKENLFGDCIECMKARQKAAYQVATTFEPAKTYIDYLKEQNQYDYYKRTLKYQV